MAFSAYCGRDHKESPLQGKTPPDVHFVRSVPVGAGLVPAHPRATTRVAPT